MLCCVVLCYVTLHYITLYYIILPCIILYYITVYYMILYYTGYCLYLSLYTESLYQLEMLLGFLVFASAAIACAYKPAHVVCCSENIPMCLSVLCSAMSSGRHIERSYHAPATQ